MSYYPSTMDTPESRMEFFSNAGNAGNTMPPRSHSYTQGYHQDLRFPSTMIMQADQTYTSQSEAPSSLPATQQQQPIQDVTTTTTTIQKRTDEPDPSCRPRLTTEQTNILEHYFTVNPRPNTQEKRVHASELGLTLEKVNNWYQNRRAKVKQQNRTRKEYSVLSYGEPPWPQRYDYSSDLSLPGFGSPSMQGSEPESTPTIFSADQTTNFPFPRKAEDESVWKENRHKFMAEPAVAQFPFTPYDYADNDAFALGDSTGPEYEFLDQYYQRADATCPPTLPNGHWANLTGSNIWPSAQVTSSFMLGNAQFHQQSEGTSVSSNNSLTNSDLPTDTDDSDSKPVDEPQSAQTVLQDQAAVSSPRSSPLSASPSSAEVMPGAAEMSRRESEASDLAKNFNSFKLQRLNSQQNSDEEALKASQILQSNLAARRKRSRPATLGNLRSVSSTAISAASPEAQINTLRHAKSTGNNLNMNVLSGRVHKASLSGLSSAQRSPLNFATFQEAGAFSRVQAFADQQSEHQTPNTPPDSLDRQDCSYFPASLSEQFQQSTMASTGFQTPFIVTSPPPSPFVHAPMFGNTSQAGYMAPPQSAPAHSTSFANMSPPMPALPETPSYFPPQAHLSDSFPFFGAHMTPALQMPTYHMGQAGLHGFAAPQVVNQSPTLGTYYNPYATQLHLATPPKKELEVVFSTFPTPAGASSPPKQQQRPQQYTFQNSGPGDFEGESS